MVLIFTLFQLIVLLGSCTGSLYMDQLYRDLMYSYLKGVRPVQNVSDVLKIQFGAKFIRLIDLDEKSQVLTTNLWLDMRWTDHKLIWVPNKYEGIEKLRIPADLLWLPDIILYTNAMGDPHVTIYTDATVYFNGTVMWQPPAIYKSFCEIEIGNFPYDEQKCDLKFGMWSYDAQYVDIIHLNQKETTIRTDTGTEVTHCVNDSMDLDYYYLSAEWDIMNITSERQAQIYDGCCGKALFVDLTYKITLKRKSLFYTINLVVPCVMIAMQTTVVFYLSDHKITFSISVMVTLSVFLNVLVDLLPPTSIVLPLVGEYVLFSMFLVTASIVIIVMNLNVKYRSANLHGPVPRLIKTVFIKWLPPYIFMYPFKGGDYDAEATETIGNCGREVSSKEAGHVPIFTDTNMSRISAVQSRKRLQVSGLKFVGERSPSPQLSKPNILQAKSLRDFNEDYQTDPWMPNLNGARISTGSRLAPKPASLDLRPTDDVTRGFRSRSLSTARDAQMFSSNMSMTKESYTTQALRQRYLISRMLDNVVFVSQHFKADDDEGAVADEWSYLSGVLDRIFLIIFFIVNTVGTLYIWKPIFQTSDLIPLIPPKFPDNPIKN